MTRIANRTSPALRDSEPGAVIRYYRGELEMVNLAWGLRPAERGGNAFTTIRAEGREFPTHRCLLPASEFYLTHRQERWRFTLADGDHFYFAGIWRPESRDWPAAYAVLTIAANEDVASYSERQMAVIRRCDRLTWLDARVPEIDLLRPLAAGTFRAEAENASPALL